MMNPLPQPQNLHVACVQHEPKKPLPFSLFVVNLKLVHENHDEEEEEKK